MREKVLSLYAAILMFAGLYYCVLFFLQVDDVYAAWHAFFSPEFDLWSYGLLGVNYALALGIPLVLLFNGAVLLVRRRVKWWSAAGLGLLLLSGIVGYAVLAASVAVFGYFRLTRARAAG